MKTFICVDFSSVKFFLLVSSLISIICEFSSVKTFISVELSSMKTFISGNETSRLGTKRPLFGYETSEGWVRNVLGTKRLPISYLIYLPQKDGKLS